MIKRIVKKTIDVLFLDWTYGIAIQKKGKKKYHVILPTSRMSYADPFVVEKDGKAAVFVELMDYHYGWGTIGCFEIKGNRILRVKEIIRENNHMSFPNVFSHDGELYMMPETCGAGEIHLYKCERFPDLWIKQKTLINNVKLVDHAVYDDGNDTFVVSFDTSLNKSRFFILNWEKDDLEEIYPIGNYCTERPGGPFFSVKGRLFRVIQDCKKVYGDYVKFYEIDCLNKDKFDEHLIKTVKITDYNFTTNEKFEHTHQYSCSDHYSVIDYSYPRFYWNKIIRFLVRIVFHPYRHFYG